MQVGEEDLAGAKPGDLRIERLLDLHDHVRSGEDGVGVRRDRRALSCVVHVVEPAAPFPAPACDEHLVAAVGQLSDASRRHRHAVLVGLGLGSEFRPSRRRLLVLDAEVMRVDSHRSPVPAPSSSRPRSASQNSIRFSIRSSRRPVSSSTRDIR